jgi:DnaK suppressor protein
MTIDTNAYKARLEEMRGVVVEELKSIGVHDAENPADWIAVPEELELTEADENVAADRVEEWNERNATLAALETRYNNIKRALAKMENGTYGICEIGDETIEEERLNANPAARTCKAHMEEEASLPL